LIRIEYDPFYIIQKKGGGVQYVFNIFLMLSKIESMEQTEYDLKVRE